MFYKTGMSLSHEVDTYQNIFSLKGLLISVLLFKVIFRKVQQNV